MKQARYSSDGGRQQAYTNERAERWSLESALLGPVAELICKIVSRKVGHEVTFSKYAEELIKAFQASNPGKNVPDSIRGAPDLKISWNNTVKYLEVKIKKKRFHDTVTGSSKIHKYGCESHYLDDYPVYINLPKHAEDYQLNLEDIILVYAVNPDASTEMETPLQEDSWVFESITLSELKKKVDSGRYQKYAGGYGKPAWLVRCDDLVGIDTIF